jgi:hypothetical protein
MSRGAPAKMFKKFEVGIYSTKYHKDNTVETNLGPWFKGYDPSLHVNKIMEEMLRYGIDEIFLKNYSETEKQAWKDAFKSKLTEALSTRNVPIICIRNPETKMPMSMLVRLDIIDPSEGKGNIILEKIQLPQNFVSGKTSELPAALFARGTTQVMLPVVEVAVPSIGTPPAPAPPSSSSGAPAPPAPASSSSPGLINPYKQKKEGGKNKKTRKQLQRRNKMRKTLKSKH